MFVAILQLIKRTRDKLMFIAILQFLMTIKGWIDVHKHTPAGNDNKGWTDVHNHTPADDDKR